MKTAKKLTPTSFLESSPSPLPRAVLRKLKPVLPEGAVANGARSRMLTAALGLFALKSFHGTSVRDLAERLKLRPSALYAHFPSKEHLLAALVELGHSVHFDMLQAGLTSGGDDPVERLSGAVRAHARFHAKHALLAVVVNEELFAVPTALARPVLELRARSVQLLFDAVQAGRATGDFDVPHPAVAVAALGAMGMRIPYWFHKGTGLDVEELAEAQVQLALRMVGGRR